MRRKPTLIGEAQLGSSCQLSAATGLPAISMPAGFSTDGVPIGVELLGPAFAEGPLLRLAYAWEQTTHPRVAPFSTPPLVNGAAPAPVRIEAVVKGTSPAFARVMLTYDKTTGAAALRRVDERPHRRSRHRAHAAANRRGETGTDRRAPADAGTGVGQRHADAPRPIARGLRRPAGCTCTSILQRAPLGVGRTRITLP